MGDRIVVSDQKATDLRIEREVLSDATVEFRHATSEEEVLQATVDTNALVVDGYAPVTSRVFDERDDLEVVARAGIGTDNIDLAAATRNGVQVVNVPTYCAGEVATHAVTLLLGCLRKVALYDESVESGRWDWEVGRPVARLQGKTLGLVGFGTIGRRVAEMVHGFGVEIVACSPRTAADEMAEFGVEKVEFEELLAESHLISLHVPLTDETERLFDRDAFGHMGDDVILVNTARGGVVDEDALIAALDAGELAGAGLDVLETEPPGSSPLLDRDDVLVTPHVAWYSEEGIDEVRRRAAEQVDDVLSGRTPENTVNEV